MCIDPVMAGIALLIYAIILAFKLDVPKHRRGERRPNPAPFSWMWKKSDRHEGSRHG